MKSAAESADTVVHMPSLGESVDEGIVTRWLKAPGDHVDAEEPLLEVATDKVDTEIPSPCSGTVARLLADENEVVAVGADLAVITAPAVSADPGRGCQKP
jgi:2-oxoglutarate dehydrogenase E2 component (dihydrolipoamide succinyltransferase)